MVKHRGFQFSKIIINNYWMGLSMISWIIKTKVCVICRSRGLKQIIQTRGFDNHFDIMRKPNSIIVLLYIFHRIHPQKQKRSVQPFCFWGEHSKGLISAADIAFIMSSSQVIVNWLNALDQSDFLWWGRCIIIKFNVSGNTINSSECLIKMYTYIRITS